jgi:hypothetical protein
LLARHNAGWAPGNAADRLALATEIAELAGDGRDPELLAEARLLGVADLLEFADPAYQAELAEFLRFAAALGQPRLRYTALARRAMQALPAGPGALPRQCVQPTERHRNRGAVQSSCRGRWVRRSAHQLAGQPPSCCLDRLRVPGRLLHLPVQLGFGFV